MKRASPNLLSPRQAPVAASNDGVKTRVPTPRRPLTNRAVRYLQPRHGPADVRDGSSGLILTVLPSGRKQFSIRYRFGGTQRRLIFGEYPAVSLAMARKRARHAAAAIDDGRDPAGEQHAAKARPNRHGGGVGHGVRGPACPRQAARTERGGARAERRGPPRVESAVGQSTPRRDVRALVAPIVDCGSRIMANRVLAVVRLMLNYGIRNDWLDANPASLIDKPGREVSRERVLRDDEIRRLWRLLCRQPTTAERAAPGRKRSKGTPR